MYFLRSRSGTREAATSSDPSGHPLPRSSIDRAPGARRSSRRSAFSAAWSSAICRPARASDRRRASTGRWPTRTRGSRSSRSLCAIPSSRLYESSYFVGFLGAIISPRRPPSPSSTPARSHRSRLKDIQISCRSATRRGIGRGIILVRELFARKCNWCIRQRVKNRMR